MRGSLIPLLLLSLGLHGAARADDYLTIQQGALPLVGALLVVDSVQLEFGANWRANPARIEQTATVVADALLAHLRAAGYR